MRTTLLPFRIGTAGVVCLVYVIRLAMTATLDAKTVIGPSILHSDSEDEDIIVSSGQAWGSGSGHLVLDGYDQEEDEEDIRSTKATPLKLVTPDSSRMSCIVCTTVGDRSCRDPYIRNASHVQPCLTSVEGCLKVVTPSGDTYRNCLYGIFATAEKTTGCRVVKEDLHVGHKFVNATICICQTNECNGLFYTPTLGALSENSLKSLPPTTRSSVSTPPPTKRPHPSSSSSSSASGRKYTVGLTWPWAVLGCHFSLVSIRRLLVFNS